MWSSFRICKKLTVNHGDVRVWFLFDGRVLHMTKLCRHRLVGVADCGGVAGHMAETTEVGVARQMGVAAVAHWIMGGRGFGIF